MGVYKSHQALHRLADATNRWHSYWHHHEAATPPGLEVTAHVELIEVDGRRLVFSVEAYDSVDLISKGSHQRFIIDKEKFNTKVELKKKSGIL